jgi:hypothetical protein
MADDLKTSIAENAAGPKRARGDQGEVEQHSLPDQIAADRYLGSKSVSARPHRAVRFAKLVPPGGA